MKPNRNYFLLFGFFIFSNYIFAQSKNIINFSDSISISYAGKLSGTINYDAVKANHLLKLNGASADKFKIDSFRLSLYCGGKDSASWACNGNHLDEALFTHQLIGCFLLFEYVFITDEKRNKVMIKPKQFKITK